MVPPSEHSVALHHVGVFGKILVPEFGNDINTLVEKLIGAMRTHYLRVTPNVHVLAHHVTE